MKYIFISGAPGSRWSSVCKSIYYSPDIDRSDASQVREFYHDITGEMTLMHMGAYWGPGMEFGTWFDRLDSYSKEQCEAEFDAPFSGTGVRIVKSHVFAYHIDYIKKTWPDCPIIVINRNEDACLGLWIKCGGFDITYPKYNEYYKDIKRMSKYIRQETSFNSKAVKEWPSQKVITSLQLSRLLKIQDSPKQYFQNYTWHDYGIEVSVI